MTESRPHRFTRRDKNQQEITEALRHLGFHVIDTSPLGGKVLDLMVCGYHPISHFHRWLHVEVKMPGKKLTNGEKAFFAEWPQCPAIVARSTEDVLDWFSYDY